MAYNGTAVVVVNVTGAAIRLIVPFASMELSRWQASMAQFLPVPANDKVVTVHGIVQSRKSRYYIKI
jgi:hypothetical protein